MERADTGPGSRFIMRPDAGSGALGTLKYLGATLLVAYIVAYLAYAIGFAIEFAALGGSDTVSRVVSASIGGAVVLLGIYFGAAGGWSGETHFEAVDGRLLVRQGTRRLRGRAVAFSLTSPVVLEGRGSHGHYTLSIRQDGRRVAIGNADDLIPHEYARWQEWIRSVGGLVDMRWQISSHLHMSEVPIALDVASRYEPLPLPTSLNAPLEFAVPSADDSSRARSAGSSEVAVRSAALSWQVLPQAKRSRQPVVHVGEAYERAPRIAFPALSDRVWLRRGPYVIELRFKSSVDAVAISHEQLSDWLCFTPARIDHDGATSTAASDG